jgi:branched chain amino acid efflux pump
MAQRGLTLDARAAGLAVAVVALLLRAPFLVVVVLAAATAAGLRYLGWG